MLTWLEVHPKQTPILDSNFSPFYELFLDKIAYFLKF